MEQDTPNSPQRKPRRPPKPPKKITADYLHNAGLYYLQRFAASSSHFRRVMTRKIEKSCRYHDGQDRDECLKLLDRLVARFEESGLLNDEGYSRGMVASLRRRGLSARAIHARLSAKGLSAAQIEQALGDHGEDRSPDETDLIAALRLARRKRIGPWAPPRHEEPDIEKRAVGKAAAPRADKDLSTLARAGYSYDIAHRVMTMDYETAVEMITWL